jgi:type IV pilus assembly protein PilQ
MSLLPPAASMALLLSLGRGCLSVAVTFAAAMSLLWAPPGARAQPAGAPVVQSVTAGVEGGAEVVRIVLSQPVAGVPQAFATQSPARVSIDLAGVGNGIGRQSVELGEGNARSARLVEAGERLRLVLNLRQSAPFRLQVQDRTLLVLFDGGSAASAAAAQPATTTVRDIDFRRTPDGAGRVVIALSQGQGAAEVRQQGKGLLVEFPRAALAQSLRRRLDVSDFGTPVQSVTSNQTGERVTVFVEPRGSWEHIAYQADDQFVLEVRTTRTDPNKLSPGPGFTGEKLTLNFQSIDVRSALQVIADFTNFNVVTSDSVSGTIMLRLKDVPWDQALDIIMQSKGLGMRRSGNVLWIAPRDELSAREQVELEARKKMADLEPLRTQPFQLNYTKADDVARSLAGQSGGAGVSAGGGGQAVRILSSRGSVIADARTNQLFITDIPSKLEEIQLLISRIDIPVRQVLIEARIVEADDTFGRSLGVRLGGSDLRGLRSGVPGYPIAGDTRIVPGGNLNAVGYQTSQIPAAGTLPFNDSTFVNLPANTSSFGGASPATFALSLFSATANRFLNLELSALEATGRGKIVSSPRVVTADQEKATVAQGEELPYQAATSSGATNVQFRKAALRLEVQPQITPEGNVILDVDVSKDSVGRATTAGFAIDTKQVKTKVLVENGGTVVIGGIYTQVEKDELNKVPLLGDLPMVGNLFQNKQRVATKTELLVFITPKIISDRPEGR